MKKTLLFSTALLSLIIFVSGCDLSEQDVAPKAHLDPNSVLVFRLGVLEGCEKTMLSLNDYLCKLNMGANGTEWIETIDRVDSENGFHYAADVKQNPFYFGADENQIDALKLEKGKLVALMLDENALLKGVHLMGMMRAEGARVPISYAVQAEKESDADFEFEGLVVMTNRRSGEFILENKDSAAVHYQRLVVDSDLLQQQMLNALLSAQEVHVVASPIKHQIKSEPTELKVWSVTLVRKVD